MYRQTLTPVARAQEGLVMILDLVMLITATYDVSSFGVTIKSERAHLHLTAFMASKIQEYAYYGVVSLALLLFFTTLPKTQCMLNSKPRRNMVHVTMNLLQC